MSSRGFKAYQIHVSMMLHFNPKSDYDFFKYRGKTNAKLESFQSDKVKVRKYFGIEKRVGYENLELFFFASLKDEMTRFRKFVPQPWYKTFKNFQKEIDNFENTFHNDLLTIRKLFAESKAKRENLFKANENQLHPLLYSWYSKGYISELTFIFFDLYIERFLESTSSNDPVLWKSVIEEYRHKENFFDRYVFCLHNKDELIRQFELIIGQ
ncbi:MAG: hypothetical protein R3230_01090 [Nitrosopumilaceae archaeon]|nr:hypothetical protein [Nitrosopumilaceae archaeon]